MADLSKYLYYDHDGITIYCGDCLPVMQGFPDNHFDSIVTDPPYGLRFMGKRWDYDVPSVEIWREGLRVLKPGGPLLSFGGARTYHRMVVAIEDAGFEIRDQIMWVYGSGFPKSRNIGKDVEKKQVGGIKNMEVIGERPGLNNENGTHGFSYQKEYVPGKSIGGKQLQGTIPIYKVNNDWDGWGTALKPAHEPICLARKPLDGTVAENVLKWGTGGINVDGSRIGTEPAGARSSNADGITRRNMLFGLKEFSGNPTQGRFPANFIHDGSDEVVGLFPVTKSGGGDRNSKGKTDLFTGFGDTGVERTFPANIGSAARFFYCAKASRAERGEGNNHPTVKPLKLMEYLVRLVTPPGGVVLDPFMGSGTTGIACRNKGFKFVGIDHTEDHCEMAKRRIDGICAIAKRRLSQEVFDF